jgi:hypothetical protein
MNWDLRFALIIIAIGTTTAVVPQVANARPRRHPSELDLKLRSEWDGDLKSYVKSIKEERRQDAVARSEQRQLRAIEERETTQNRRNFVRSKSKQALIERKNAARAVYFEEVRYRKEQDRIRKEFAMERAHERTERKLTRQARLNNFKSVRLAMIQFKHEENKTRKPAMLKMPKPDTTALKAAGDTSVPGQFAPNLPPPSMDPGVVIAQPAIFNDVQAQSGPPMTQPSPVPEQSASAAPTFAPNGADTSRAFGGAAR